MLRIQPIGYAPLPLWYEPFAVDGCEAEAIAAAPWRYESRCDVVESCSVLVDQNYLPPCGYRYPLEHVSTALTIENALWQRNLLLQAGVGYEHVGMLVVYGQYSAKGASLQAVMPAVWASAEYAKLVDKKRSLLNLPSAADGP